MLLVPLSYFNVAFLWLWITSVFSNICTSISHCIHSSHTTGPNGTCIICLYALSLKIFDNISCDTVENLIHILATFSTGFEKLKSMLVSQSLTSCRVNHFGIIWHVQFICYKYFFNIRHCMLINLLQPVLYIIECSFVSDIINQ
mgnify:CR=1 FL=1